MSRENLRNLQTVLGTTWVRPPYFSIHNLAVELAKRADDTLTDEELRAATSAVRGIVAAAETLAPYAERDPAVRIDEHRDFARMLLALLASPPGKKALAEHVERVRRCVESRRELEDAKQQAARVEEQIRREAQWRAEAAAMSIEQIVNEIERAGYALAARDGKLLIPRTLPHVHRFRAQLRKNEIIEYLNRRAEHRAAVEEV